MSAFLFMHHKHLENKYEMRKLLFKFLFNTWMSFEDNDQSNPSHLKLINYKPTIDQVLYWMDEMYACMCTFPLINTP